MNAMLPFHSGTSVLKRRSLHRKMMKPIFSAVFSIFLLSNANSQTENCSGSNQAGKPHGQWQCTYSGGQVQSQTNYNEGIMEGSRKEYYENGQLKLDAVYSNNQLNGLLKEYFESGTLKYEGTFSNGNPSGLHKQYKSDGTIDTQHDFGS